MGRIKTVVMTVEQCEQAVNALATLIVQWMTTPASTQYYGWSSRLGLINHGQWRVLTGGPFSPDDRHQHPGAGSADTQVLAERLGRDRSLVGDPMADVFLPGAFNQVTGGGDGQRPVRIVARRRRMRPCRRRQR